MALTENTEMFVKGARSKTPIIVSVLLAIACAVILFVLAAFTGYAALILAVPVIAVFALAARLVYTRSVVEYEYSVMAGVFSVTKIMNQTKRKEIVSVDVKEISEFGLSDKERMQKDMMTVQTDLKVIDCTGDTVGDGDDNDKVYFFRCRDSKGGMLKVYFTPNEKILEALRLKSPEVMRVLRRI
ncbi:MAG: hypothetical protein E7384_04360 [Ruminococcaceae bacterium]|nr:hypothetical protein [Oscillospiraceae bacterium]